MRLFSPAPYFRRTAALTRPALCGRVSPSNGRNAGCTQERLLVPQDCGQVPASPRKSSRDSVAAAFQGLWKITTCIWQASLLTTLFQHQRLWPFSAVCRDQVASTVSAKCPSSSGTSSFSPSGLRTSRTPLCSWGFALPTRAPPGRELRSCSLCAPLVYSLNGI